MKCTGVAQTLNLGFSTKYFDRETGLYYYGRRYYNPSTGRWTNEDPSGEDGGLNLYAACGNDLVNLFDALGENAYMVYRPLNITGLSVTWPLTGHVFLAFDDTGMGTQWQGVKQAAGMGNQVAVTMSFHPYKVFADRQKDPNTKNEITTFLTAGSFVDLNEPNFDQAAFFGNGQKLLVTGNECEQINLFQTAMASKNLNNSNSPDPGPYSFLSINCAFWATTMVTRAGLNSPAGASWNLGTGTGKGLDRLQIGQAITYIGATIYSVNTNFKFSGDGVSPKHPHYSQ